MASIILGGGLNPTILGKRGICLLGEVTGDKDQGWDLLVYGVIPGDDEVLTTRRSICEGEWGEEGSDLIEIEPDFGDYVEILVGDKVSSF